MTKEDVLKLKPLEIRELMVKKNAEIEKLDREIDKLDNDMETIMTNCPHVNKVMKERAHTTYSFDDYIECYECRDCGWHWQELVIVENRRNGDVENN